MSCSIEPQGRRGAVAACVAALFAAACALVTGSTGAAEPPLSAAVVAYAATAVAGGTDGYTISISNVGTHPVTISSIFDDLPAGFSYLAGSTSGPTSADPVVSSGRLVWAGPFAVPDGSVISLRFQVKVAGQTGRYLDVAGGVGPDGSFDSGPAAPIDVVGEPPDPPPPPPPRPAVPADLAVSLSLSPATAHPGDPVAAAVGVANLGPGNATGIRLEVSIPPNLTAVAVRTDSGTCSGTTTISCALGGLYRGRSATVTVDAVAAAVGDGQAAASARGDDPDPDLSGNTASATLDVLAPAIQPPPPPPPAAGETVNVEPAAGEVLVKVPSSNSFVPLTQLRQIPVGSEVDATAGKVDLTVALKGATYSASFYQGRFVVLQPSGVAAEVRLVGGDFASCSKKARRALGLGAAPRTVRRLWGKGKGRFRTRGRYSSATVRGTTWLVADRCDGTLTKVVQGTVNVTDLVAHKNVVVRAGKSYLAARPH